MSKTNSKKSKKQNWQTQPKSTQSESAYSNQAAANQKYLEMTLSAKYIDRLLNPKTDVLREQIDSVLSVLEPTQKTQFEKYYNLNKPVFAKDAYVNGLAQTGLYTSDPANAGEFPPTPQLTWDFMRIQRIYRSQPLVSKISNAYAFEQLKSGIDVQSDTLSSDRIMYLESEVDKLTNILCSTANWGYVFGLSAAVIMVDGQINQDDLLKPLKNIEKDTFLGLKTVVRWQGIMPTGMQYVDLDDIADKDCSVDELGEPLYYEVQFANGNRRYTVHRSRLLLFSGKKLEGVEKQIEMGCGVSLIENIYLPLINYLAVINYVLKMLQISQERVLNSSDFDKVALLSASGQAAFEQKMSQIANNSNTGSFICLGEDDVFDYKGANFANVDKIVQCSQEDLAAAANMPLNKLFGKSPTGMNSSSEENLTDFYDFIDRERNGDMKHNLYKLLPVLYASKYGEELPDDVTFKFRSLWIPDEEEKALIIDRKMRPIEKAWETNVITLEQYYREAQRVGKMTDSFAFISDKLFGYLAQNNLADVRYSDFAKGLIVGGEWVSTEKELRNLVKRNLAVKKDTEAGGLNE